MREGVLWLVLRPQLSSMGRGKREKEKMRERNAASFRFQVKNLLYLIYECELKLALKRYFSVRKIIE
jgi:hypothetical protein